MSHRQLTVMDLRKDGEITTYLEVANHHLANAGYTEHGLRHARLVSDIASNVMRRLRRSEEERRLVSIAGYMHDIGNVMNRRDHASVGAVMTWDLLRERGMPAEETAVVAGAVGNHEHEGGRIVNSVGAALILADKSDVHRSRVRLQDPAEFDIHDRVNYAAEESFLDVATRTGTVTLRVKIDTEISPVMDYFEIFLPRMLMCRRAAAFLDQKFRLEVNGMHLL